MKKQAERCGALTSRGAGSRIPQLSDATLAVPEPNGNAIRAGRARRTFRKENRPRVPGVASPGTAEHRVATENTVAGPELAVGRYRKAILGRQDPVEVTMKMRRDIFATRKITSISCTRYGIPAGAFVALETRLSCMADEPQTVLKARRGHVPKLRLGETHVPVDFLLRREKTLPVVVKIGYARH